MTARRIAKQAKHSNMLGAWQQREVRRLMAHVDPTSLAYVLADKVLLPHWPARRADVVVIPFGLSLDEREAVCQIVQFSVQLQNIPESAAAAGKVGIVVYGNDLTDDRLLGVPIGWEELSASMRRTVTRVTREVYLGGLLFPTLVFTNLR